MKATIFSLAVAALLIGGSYFFTSKNGSLQKTEKIDNVSIENETQIITIRAKGGFSPEKTTARAGIPTILRFETNGTFDCSSSVRIPELKISKNLPLSGETDIDIGVPKAALLQGFCAMGMYPFEIEFI
jgi:plastocyanin domain-containing protein